MFQNFKVLQMTVFFSGGIILISLLFASGSSVNAQATCVAELPGPNNCYKLYQPKGKPRGLVVLLPGFGDTIDFFDLYEFPKMMRDRGYLVAAFSMAGYLEWEKDINTLHKILTEITTKNEISPGTLVIGGFSAGGAGAVRYAEYCVDNGCSDTVRAAGVFSVDAPLDVERWWGCHARKIDRKPEDAEGSKFIKNTITQIFGGTPAEKRSVYAKAAPLMVSEPNGGNARFLKETPVRAYSEPDIAWTLDNWGNDYYCHNAVDQAALIYELKTLGNKNAEYIATSGKGYRAEFVKETQKYRKGERWPHSWMIVDEKDLATWIERHTGGRRGN
jgi:hypothetical protein